MPVARKAAGPIGPDEADILFADFAALPLVALAVSGGRDSMALLRLMEDWSRRDRQRPRPVALSVDHGLRIGSDREVAQVGLWCADIGIRHQVLNWVGPKPTSRIQELAREARYALLTGWCARHGASALAVAHHLEDQSETLLMRLAHSSGVDGLAGMASAVVRDGIIIARPLLDVPRARLEATLAALGQPWIDDPANDNPVFERVRLRGVAGALEVAGLTSAAIAGSAAKLARAARALDTMAARAFEQAVALEPGGYAWLDPETLSTWPDEIVIRVACQVLHRVGGGARLSDGSLARIAAGIVQRPFTGMTLGRCRITQIDGRLLVAREHRGLPNCAITPGTRLVWDNRFAVSLAQGEGGVELRPLGRVGFSAARRLNAALSKIPAPAGAVLPGGYRGDVLELAPALGVNSAGAPLAVRFLQTDVGGIDE